MSQYVVVYLPSMTLEAEAVGPFRSRRRAQAVAEALDEADEMGETSGAESPPQVVTLTDLSTALARLRGERTEVEG